MARTCQMCDGTRFYPIGSNTPCYVCDAMGVKQNSPTRIGVDHFYSHEILACIDNGEYAALNDTKKDAIRIILGLGIVNMSQGGTEKTRLYSIFPEGTVTQAKIKTLLEE